jgi:hypothetical protein
MSAPQQALDVGNLGAAPRYRALDVCRPLYYFAFAGGGAHLWPVFATHPIW